MWDLIILISDRCLSIFFVQTFRFFLKALTAIKLYVSSVCTNVFVCMLWMLLISYSQGIYSKPSMARTPLEL